MSRAVWKFPFPGRATTLETSAPAGSTPRAFAFQGPRPTIWIEVDVEEKREEVWTFVVVGTGHPIPDGEWTYVGSALVDGGAFVFHAYARLGQG